MLRRFDLRRFRDDRRGVAAVEFALIAPVMVGLYLGLAELTMGMMAERRAAHTASVVADLVAQSTQMNATQMTDIFNVAPAIMKPYPAATLTMRVTSVKADAAASPKVVWSRGSGMTALSAGTTASAVPADLLSAGESIIVAEVAYTYDSPLGHVLPDDLQFGETFFLRPRKSTEVAWTS